MSVKEYLKEQIEWVKDFFEESKGGKPSHKNLIGMAIIAVFLIAFMKKTIGADDIPDVPVGWQLIILTILGIRSLQAATEKFIEYKSKNGKLEITKDEKESGD